MRRLALNMVLAAAVTVLSGCATPKHIIAVSPVQFEAAYRLPSHYWGLRTEFRQDSHYADIDFYRWGTLSWSEYTGTWRTPIESVPHGLLREARTVFKDGPDLNEKQKEMLDAAMLKARAAGLFAPELFPTAPTISRTRR
jgi:hypothetical protein